MPIEIPYAVECLAETAFHDLDYKVMKHAFDLYNSMGNLWDEDDYRTRLHERCNQHGIKTHQEVPVRVSFADFSKTYFIDLLAEGSVYELKTTPQIAKQHQSQTLNYLFLTHTHHGKIINFRPDSLQWEFTSTQLTRERRAKFFVDTENWQADGGFPIQLPDIVSELLNEWGTFLDLYLYKEAMLHFLNLPADNTRKRFCPATDGTLFHFTSLNRKKSVYQKNLNKYLQASTCHKIEWINFDRNQIELHTLSKK